MPALRTPLLILTGGTISSTRNAAGELVPREGSLDEAIRHAGLSDAPMEKLFGGTLDSIDFNIGEHYPRLRDAVTDALDKQHTPIVVGGTDTLVWYSTLLTRDLMRRRRLGKDSGEAVIFLSSMKTAEEAPRHVENILKAGKRASEIGLSGGVALCAKDDDANTVIIHDVTNGLDKISGSVANAFRSLKPVGELDGGDFKPDPDYRAPSFPPAMAPSRLSRVAPPLLRMHSDEASLAYLECMERARPPFDCVIFEGNPPTSADFAQACKRTTQSGMRVLFCNPVRFNEANGKMEPALSPSLWGQRYDDTVRILEKDGAEFITALPKDAYIEARLDAPRGHIGALRGGGASRVKQEVFGIRYVPDAEIMQATLKAIGRKAKNIFFLALPHNAMPDRMASELRKYPAAKFNSRFEYEPDGEPNPYSAGQDAATLLSPAIGNSVSKIIRETSSSGKTRVR